jgi:L-lysine 6-transaminase
MAPESVKEILSKHVLTRGMMPLVLDMERSHGVDLYDMRDGRKYLDFFGFYASSAIGMNHEKLVGNEDFRRRLVEAAVNKITNSDVITPHMGRFVNTFSRVGIPEYLPYAFFVAGGALAVENALKAAFDWKVRMNFKKGYRREVGTKVLHFDQAFHGRSGYTLSLTNTADPKKTMYFPKFDWPRVVNPFIRYPLTDESQAALEIEEQTSLRQIKQAFRDHGDDIACVIIEPIQGEGGDNHFRREFLQAVKDLAHENDALLIFDEVQSGVGITGSFWAHQSIGVEPDIIAFGKKTQVCGILASRKLDEIDGHVFQTPSRINSTWGGNLVDMVRFDRILEVIEEDDLIEHAATVGRYLLDRLRELEASSAWIRGTRGRGLMCAFDLPNAAFRDVVLERCMRDGVIILGCGTRSVRFRSPLTITEAQVDQGLDVLSQAVRSVAEER